MKQPLYSLSNAWLAYCQALKVQVSDVLELAAQGSVVEAYRLLQERLAGTGTGAIGVARPQGAPFAPAFPVATSGQDAGPQPAMQDAATGVPAPSAPNGVPTAGFAAAAGAAVLRGQSVSASKTVRRFRPLVRSQMLMVRSLSAPHVSMQVFVWSPPAASCQEGFQ